MGQVVSRVFLEDLRSWRIVDPLNRSWCHHSRLCLMLPNDRCCLNLRRCFVLAMMPNLGASSMCVCVRKCTTEKKRKRENEKPNWIYRFNWAHFPFTPITKIQYFFFVCGTGDVCFSKYWSEQNEKNNKRKKSDHSKIKKIKTNSKCDCTDDADDASSACPNSESRSSVLLRSCEDESRDRFTFSFERLRSRPRNAAAAAKMVGSRFLMPAASRSGLMPCCARYKSMLFIRFCGGGGVCKWLFRRSSVMSHGTDVDVCRVVMFIYEWGDRFFFPQKKETKSKLEQ